MLKLISCELSKVGARLYLFGHVALIGLFVVKGRKHTNMLRDKPPPAFKMLESFDMAAEANAQALADIVDSMKFYYEFSKSLPRQSVPRGLILMVLLFGAGGGTAVLNVGHEGGRHDLHALLFLTGEVLGFLLILL